MVFNCDTRQKKEVQIVKTSLESEIRGIIEAYANIYPKLEVHSIKIYGKYSYVNKKIDYHIYADVREQGQLFFGVNG